MTDPHQPRRSAARLEVDRLNNGHLPSYCTAEISRHGKVCVYYRRVGRTGRIRMRAEPGSADFYANYASLLNGDVAAPARPARAASTPKTWRWVCAQYFQSMPFRSLASDGQRLRRRLLEATYTEPTKPGSIHLFGDFPMEHFDARAARFLRDRKVKWVRNEKGEEVRTNLGAANSRLKYVRAVLAFAKEDYPEIVSRNWAADVSYFATGSEGHPTWSLDEIVQFERHHAVGTKARLVMALALYSGQRRGDLGSLGRIVERDGMLQIVQEKNREKNAVTAFIPVVPPLRAILDASPTGDLFYIVKGNGQPYAKESLGNLFHKWCDEAGLLGRSLHGLRKACVVRLIMDDCTPHEIMSVTGHRTLKEIDRYAREYMREKAAASVLAKWIAKHAA